MEAQNKSKLGIQLGSKRAVLLYFTDNSNEYKYAVSLFEYPPLFFLSGELPQGLASAAIMPSYFSICFLLFDQCILFCA